MESWNFYHRGFEKGIGRIVMNAVDELLARKGRKP
jgi:hypothetical protein